MCYTHLPGFLSNLNLLRSSNGPEVTPRNCSQNQRMATSLKQSSGSLGCGDGCLGTDAMENKRVVLIVESKRRSWEPETEASAPEVEAASTETADRQHCDLCW